VRPTPVTARAGLAIRRRARYCHVPQVHLAKGPPMFAVIRYYHFDKKDSAEIDRLIEEQFVPIIRKAKGFDRYYWLDSGNGEGASFGLFKDKDGADESVA